MSQSIPSSPLDDNRIALGIPSGVAKYECQLDKRKYRYIIGAVFKETGESLSDILLRQMKQSISDKRGV